MEVIHFYLVMMVFPVGIIFTAFILAWSSYDHEDES